MEEKTQAQVVILPKLLAFSDSTTRLYNNNNEQRYLLILQVSIYDLVDKLLYVDKTLQVSDLMMIDEKTTERIDGGIDPSMIFDIKQKLFGQINEQIFEMIDTGKLTLKSKFGYETLENRTDSWFLRQAQFFNVQRLLQQEELTPYGDSLFFSDTQDRVNEIKEYLSNREIIEDIDRYGNKARK